MSNSRETKYTKEILSVVANLLHATNADILAALRPQFPDVSATTVHRATARLQERGAIGLAPVAADGSMRYDATTTPHDHFICMVCGGIRDIDVAKNLIPVVSEALGGCRVTGRLVINGSCETCIKKGGGV